VENIRGAAAHLICPVAAGFDGSKEQRHMVAGHLGITPERSHVSYLAFSPKDAKRRFTSENPSLWTNIEADLKLQLAAQNDRWPVVDQARGLLSISCRPGAPGPTRSQAFWPIAMPTAFRAASGAGQA